MIMSLVALVMTGASACACHSPNPALAQAARWRPDDAMVSRHDRQVPRRARVDSVDLRPDTPGPHHFPRFSSTTWPVDPQAMQHVGRLLDAEAAAHRFGSMTVAVVVRGRPVLVRSYGFADPQKRIKATPQTLYRIGSITKQFTGFALLKLAEDGRLKLSEPASRYVPELVQPLGAEAELVDLVSLATHRSGLAREPADPALSSGPMVSWQTRTRAGLAITKAPFPRNTEARYSNIGYAALGLAIEKAAGQSYDDFVDQALLRPLGMRSTSFSPSRKELSRLAVGHRPDGDVLAPRAELENGRGYRVPNGGLFSTAPDLARFMAFEMGLARGAPLNADRLKQNYMRTFPAAGGGRFGIGFAMEDHEGRTLIGHNGLVTGYASSAFFDPETQIGIVCLGSAENMCQSRFIEVYAALSDAWKPVASRMQVARERTAARVLAQRPYAAGERVLHRLLVGLSSGSPDYPMMGSRLSGAVRDNLPALHRQFAELGTLRSIRFVRVDPAGNDVYLSQFANGALEWTVTLDESDMLTAAIMKPAP